jgi:hypothetical protein
VSKLKNVSCFSALGRGGEDSTTVWFVGEQGRVMPRRVLLRYRYMSRAGEKKQGREEEEEMLVGRFYSGIGGGVLGTVLIRVRGLNCSHSLEVWMRTLFSPELTK